MAGPEVPIDVDAATGIWRTDGLAMVYLPRHFLVNNHLAAEEALGFETYRGILRQATEKSALHWCRSESRTHGLSPDQTFRHYFKRLSQRGWGRFAIERLDTAAGRGLIDLEYSVFALESGPGVSRPVCYMFEGFMTGAFHYLMGDTPGPAMVQCYESYCAAMGQHDKCRFEFTASR
jgi:hypothetical protein